eukprot:TRINITY_DN10602_c0_g1_i5.p1 TRINITY_DN10602_c0_g1~~TRINITY_DN10602_c0_g1_i5.p1  ORF type:complete len:293 (-),score=70.40 TRINITY_DN10602_c0_g1_i5:82-960(-)
MDAQLLASAVISRRPKFSQNWAETASRNLDLVRKTSPLVHHLTNYVAMNDNANITLQAGGRPVMAHENSEIVNFADALVINLGTIDPIWEKAFFEIGEVATNRNIPIILDPVGIGASKYRLRVAQSLLQNLRVTVLKGNAGEIAAIAGLDEQLTSGVDTIGKLSNAHMVAKAVASKWGCVVAMTGKTDYISDGIHVVSVHNNHQFLPTLTATGCSLSSVVGCFVAAGARSPLFDPLSSTVSALSYFSFAGEVAGARAQIFGPGSFRSELLNCLWEISPEDLVDGAKIAVVEC